MDGSENEAEHANLTFQFRSETYFMLAKPYLFWSRQPKLITFT